MNPKKQHATYQIITEDPKNKLGKGITITSSNIIEESFANATSNDIFTAFEEELVTEDIIPSTLMNQGNIEVLSSTPIAAPSGARKQDEFDIFGNFVAEIMRNVTKQKARFLQMNIMKVITDAESDS